ncbi:MAG: uracil-DNA glycosylase [Pseudomonadota bacterium]
MTTTDQNQLRDNASGRSDTKFALSPAALKALLQWHMEVGVETFVDEEPHPFAEAISPGAYLENRPPHSGPVGSVGEPSAPMSEPSIEPLKTATPVPTGTAIKARAPIDRSLQESNEPLAKSAATLEALKSLMADVEGCALKPMATNMVFADGNPEADLMLIGEAPGAEEDRQGKPFVGASGQLLDKMLAAAGWDRTSVYIANILPWRPPGNRKPNDGEITMYLPFVRRHIELINPKLIVALGGTSASALLETRLGITKLRGRFAEIEVAGQRFDFLPTFHPSYLLRQPQLKGDAWQDWLAARNHLMPKGDA